VGKEAKIDVGLFLGNAGTAMRPFTAAVTAAGGNLRSVYIAPLPTLFFISF
jgi:5-enolpyruvylshikimate-3-phosphate synthase